MIPSACCIAQEEGYNAIHLNQLTNSWVRHVRILNADSGIYLWGVTFSTILNLEIGVTKPRRGVLPGVNTDGHRGIWTEYGNDNLVTNFSINCVLQHDLTVSSYETMSVFERGNGQNLNVDFHRESPFCNLFSNLNHGVGSRLMESGGDFGAGECTVGDAWQQQAHTLSQLAVHDVM